MGSEAFWFGGFIGSCFWGLGFGVHWFVLGAHVRLSVLRLSLAVGLLCWNLCWQHSRGCHSHDCFSSVQAWPNTYKPMSISISIICKLYLYKHVCTYTCIRLCIYTYISLSYPGRRVEPFRPNPQPETPKLQTLKPKPSNPESKNRTQANANLHLAHQ